MTKRTKLEEVIRELHCEITAVHDYLDNGDEISYKFAVPQCVECRVDYPCMTISVIDD